MIHTFTQMGQNIVLDIASGAVHLFDQMAFDLVRKMTPPMPERCPDEILEGLPYDKEELREIWAELYALVEQGMLFSTDDYPELADGLPTQTPVKALCLHVCHDCNLRCPYCFAATGDFGMGRSVMPPETALRAIDFVVERSGGRRNIEIDFFGGEPLLAMDTVRETVRYAKALEAKSGKNFRFTLTTNGLLLDEETGRYLNEVMDNVVLSLDGRPEVHDPQRPMIGGGGSYRHVVPRIKSFVDTREGDYYVRGTFTRRNLDFGRDIEHLAGLGMKSISIEPVVLPQGAPGAIREEDLPAIFSEYDRLARKMLEDDFSFFHYNVDLGQGPCLYKRLRGCGAGFEYLAVTPEGDLYPCHQFVGKEEYRMGSVLTGEFDAATAQRFASMNLYTRDACSSCWARYYCTGGCSAANLNENGDMNRVYQIGCAMEKKRLECAIALSALRRSQPV